MKTIKNIKTHCSSTFRVAGHNPSDLCTPEKKDKGGLHRPAAAPVSSAARPTLHASELSPPSAKQCASGSHIKGHRELTKGPLCSLLAMT